jgi:prepilin-type N-terminal cleavage/methylation domain-containing protein
MTTSTPCIELRAKPQRGFTLTEVIISSSLALVLLAAVLGTFLFIGRSGVRASNYSELEAEARRGLVVFAEDVRLANDIRWHSPQLITLQVTLPVVGPKWITYGYDANERSPTYGCFYRQEGKPEDDTPRVPLVRKIASDFAFKRYKLEHPRALENFAETDRQTKQLQVTFRAVRSGATTATATHSLVSARYVLRNKRVSE